MKFEHFAELHGEHLEFQVGQAVFREGARDQYIYLLKQGVLKALYLSEAGNELIKAFARPGEIIGSLASAHWGQATNFDLIALDRSRLLRVDFRLLYQQAGNDLELGRDVIDRLLLYGRQKERRERELLTLSAEGRYRSLLDEFPSVLDQVKQKDIARFLGITPVALSRIRKKMSQRG